MTPPRNGFPLTSSIRNGGRNSLFFVVIALFVFHLYSLLRTPPCFVDEVWALNRAVGLIQTGWAFGTQDIGITNEFPGYERYFPWLPTALHALGVLFIGEPNLWAVRLISFLAGCLIIFSAVQLVRKTAGADLVLPVILVMGLSPVFILMSHLGRFDVLATSMAMFGLTIFAAPTSKTRSLVAGFCMALAYEMHPHSAVLGPCFVVIAIYNRGSLKLWTDPRNYLLSLGFAIGALGYLTLHVFPNPDTFFSLQRILFSSTHTPPILTPTTSVLLGGISETWNLIQFMYEHMIVVLVWSIVVLLLNRSNADKLLLTLLLVTFLSFALLIRHKFTYYAIYLSPIVDVVIARAFQLTLCRSAGSKIFVQGFVVGLFIITVLFPAINLVLVDQMVEWRRIEQIVRSEVESDDVLIGNQKYWLAVPDNKFFSLEALIYMSRGIPRATLEEDMKKLRPTMIIADETWGFISQAKEMPGYIEFPREEMLKFVDEYSTLVNEFDTRSYGVVRMYRIHWDKTNVPRQIQ